MAPHPVPPVDDRPDLGPGPEIGAPNLADPVGRLAADRRPDPLAGLRPAAGTGPFARWPGFLGVRSPAAGSPWWRVAAIAAALLALGVGGWWLLRPAAPPIESSLPLASAEVSAAGGATPAAGSPGAGAGGPGGPSGAATSTTEATELVVQAAGAVARPGVYRLPAGSRVDDLVRAAGGLATGADGDRVNLAAPVADGERIWVPVVGEDAPPDVVAGAGGGAGAAGGGGPTDGAPAMPETPEVVDLNTADAAALDTLPGVGPSTAAAILAYREEHGRFTSVDDLLEVRGIGDAKLEQLRPLVRVG